MSPEQSKPLSALPPQRYGVPSDSRAVWTTSAALPLTVAGGAGGARTPAEPHPEAERRAHALPRRGGGAPEAAGPAVFEAIARLDAEREPGERPPLEAGPRAPECGHLLRARIGGEPDGEPRQRVGREPEPPAPRLQFVAQAVEGPAPSQGIMHQHGGADPVGDRTGQPGGGAEFVHGGAVAVVPAAEVELVAAALCPKRRGQEERRKQGREPPDLSRLRQRRGTPRQRAGPCDARGGAGAGA